LLGAGFSSNWGGPLPSDVFDWLLPRPEISGDAYLKQMLWNDSNAGGFENTLSQVQSDDLRVSQCRKRSTPWLFSGGDKRNFC
jgi:hypothetical protein